MRSVMRWLLRGILRWLALLLIFVGTILTSAGILWLYRPEDVTFGVVLDWLLNLNWTELKAAARQFRPATTGFLIQGVAVLLLASLAVGWRCAQAFTGEEGRRTLRALPQHPHKIRPLMRGKLRRRMRPVYLYLLVYAVPAATLAWLGGVMAFVATLLVLVLTLPAMYFVGAVGLWCAVRFRNSLGSLLGMLGFGYGGGVLLSALGAPVIAILALIFSLFVYIKESAGGSAPRTGFGSQHFVNALIPAACVVLTAIFFGMARHVLRRAEKRAFRP